MCTYIVDVVFKSKGDAFGILGSTKKTFFYSNIYLFTFKHSWPRTAKSEKKTFGVRPPPKTRTQVLTSGITSNN